MGFKGVYKFENPRSFLVEENRNILKSDIEKPTFPDHVSLSFIKVKSATI